MKTRTRTRRERVKPYDDFMADLLSDDASRLSSQGRIHEAAEVHEQIWRMKRRGG